MENGLKKEAEEWLKTRPRDKENQHEANGHNGKELQCPEELETTHCNTECKYGGDDEKSDTMIECCLCKRWYHVQCVGLTENEGEEKSVENLENENEKTTDTLGPGFMPVRTFMCPQFDIGL